MPLLAVSLLAVPLLTVSLLTLPVLTVPLLSVPLLIPEEVTVSLSPRDEVIVPVAEFEVVSFAESVVTSVAVLPDDAVFNEDSPDVSLTSEDTAEELPLPVADPVKLPLVLPEEDDVADTSVLAPEEASEAELSCEPVD